MPSEFSTFQLSIQWDLGKFCTLVFNPPNLEDFPQLRALHQITGVQSNTDKQDLNQGYGLSSHCRSNLYLIHLFIFPEPIQSLCRLLKLFLKRNLGCNHYYRLRQQNRYPIKLLDIFNMIQPTYQIKNRGCKCWRRFFWNCDFCKVHNHLRA